MKHYTRNTLILLVATILIISSPLKGSTTTEASKKAVQKRVYRPATIIHSFELFFSLLEETLSAKKKIPINIIETCERLKIRLTELLSILFPTTLQATPNPYLKLANALMWFSQNIEKIVIRKKPGDFLSTQDILALQEELKSFQAFLNIHYPFFKKASSFVEAMLTVTDPSFLPTQREVFFYRFQKKTIKSIESAKKHKKSLFMIGSTVSLIIIACLLAKQSKLKLAEQRREEALGKLPAERVTAAKQALTKLRINDTQQQLLAAFTELEESFMKHYTLLPKSSDKNSDKNSVLSILLLATPLIHLNLSNTEKETITTLLKKYQHVSYLLSIEEVADQIQTEKNFNEEPLQQRYTKLIHKISKQNSAMTYIPNSSEIEKDLSELTKIEERILNSHTHTSFTEETSFPQNPYVDVITYSYIAEDAYSACKICFESFNFKFGSFNFKEDLVLPVTICFNDHIICYKCIQETCNRYIQNPDLEKVCPFCKQPLLPFDQITPLTLEQAYHDFLLQAESLKKNNTLNQHAKEQLKAKLRKFYWIK